VKRFTYKLEAVLKQREHHEQQAQKEFAQAMKEVNGIESRIKQIELQKTNCFERNDFIPGEAVIVNDMVNNRRFVEHLYLEIAELHERLVEAQKVARHKQHFLTQAAQERQAMSRFKEKKKEEWLKENLTQEQKVLDEVGLQISARKLAR
jgi:flagellar FliJ protein